MFFKHSANGVISLMYHGTPQNSPTTNYSIRADKFSDHLHYLQRHGWHTALVKDLANPATLPDKTIILTFDDGYADNFTGAFLPLLEQNMKATWFIASDYIGKHAAWMGNEREETRMLTADQLKFMAEKGMEIAAHTCSHPNLSKLPYQQQLAELKDSKSCLETIIKDEVSSFAYPYGKYNQETLKAVRQADFKFACTTRSGWLQIHQEPYLIRRITIFANDSAKALARKLVFAANDVSMGKIFHYYVQRIKHRIF